MEENDESESDALDSLAQAFCDQLTACLAECAGGRKGLFSDVARTGPGAARGVCPAGTAECAVR